MQLSIPDELYSDYQSRAKGERKSTIELILAQLRRHLDTPITQRHITLTGAVLEAVETLVGGGSLTSPEDLVEKIQRLARISLGDIRLKFSPVQLEEIATRAQKQGKTPEQVCQDIVDQMAGQFFNGPTPLR